MSSQSPQQPHPQLSHLPAEHYRLLFENTCELLSMDEVLYDEQGNPVDWILREVNEAYMRTSGIPREKVLNRRVTEIFGLEHAHPVILNAYAEVGRTGRPVKFETRIDYFHADYMVCIFHIDGPYFGRGMMDISVCKRVQEDLTAERARFEAVLEALPVGVFLADADGRIIQTNRRVREIWRGTVLEPARDYNDYKGWWHDTGEQIKPDEWTILKVLRTGEPITGEIVDIERLDGTRAVILSSAAPLRDPDGRLTGAVAVNDDITELVALRLSLEKTVASLRRESERVAAIEGIAEAGISTLALEDLLQTLVVRMAQALRTHSCTIMVLDEETNELVTRAAYNAPENIGFRLRIGEGFAGLVAKEHRTIYVADVQKSRLALNPGMESGAVRSVLGTPLIARNRVVGMTYLNMLEVREFSPAETRLLESMAARAALAIDNAMLYEELVRSRHEIETSLDRERYFSFLLQRALLPMVPQVSDGYEVAVRYTPAYSTHEIGGDFYDVFPILGDRIGVMVGDVSGKGLEAASLAVATRNTAHAFAHEFHSAGKALTRANAVIHAQQTEIGSFVTVFLAILNTGTGSVTYASGGHPPPILLHGDGTLEELSYGQPPVALLEDIVFSEHQARIAPGDTLVVYTDGVSEARRNNVMFGQEGIERILLENREGSADQIAQAILSAVNEWASGHLADDIAIVVLSRRCSPTEESL